MERWKKIIVPLPNQSAVLFFADAGGDAGIVLESKASEGLDQGSTSSAQILKQFGPTSVTLEAIPQITIILHRRRLLMANLVIPPAL
jgi:hypothetical protein